LYEPAVLARRSFARDATTTSEQELSWLALGQPQVLIDRKPGLVGEFEPHRPAGFLLASCRAIHRAASPCHCIDADGDHLAASQLVVEGQVGSGRSLFSICGLV
jgi:hypothetical protein